jgi:hypothetical protein
MVLLNPILERPPHRTAELREVESHKGISHQAVLDDNLEGMPAEGFEPDLVGTKSVGLILTDFDRVVLEPVFYRYNGPARLKSSGSAEKTLGTSG